MSARKIESKTRPRADIDWNLIENYKHKLFCCIIKYFVTTIQPRNWSHGASIIIVMQLNFFYVQKKAFNEFLSMMMVDIHESTEMTLLINVKNINLGPVENN